MALQQLVVGFFQILVYIKEISKEDVIVVMTVCKVHTASRFGIVHPIFLPQCFRNKKRTSLEFSYSFEDMQLVFSFLRLFLSLTISLFLFNCWRCCLKQNNLSIIMQNMAAVSVHGRAGI